ncbi:endochitinase EP3-like [Rhodamnia argentea]|uniref:Endochitinase EP3-like n=1 Tax=Rhodamnia argentea TaxID=178133 RepID=A0ABM3GTU0_9MYRT|nr:endochitinase EP3-like [Rhodamnia argentea]
MQHSSNIVPLVHHYKYPSLTSIYHPSLQQDDNPQELKKLLLTALALAMIVVSALPNTTLAQNCGCAADQCCSQWGYCSTGDEYCRTSCQASPCSAPPPTNHVSVEDSVTEAFFDGIIREAAESCEGKGFSSRGTFLEVMGSYPQFGRSGVSMIRYARLLHFSLTSLLRQDVSCLS